MALVAYEMSDGSDVENENDETESAVPVDPATNSKALFNVLPKPRATLLLDSDLSKRLLYNKKPEKPKKKSVKIAVPALKDIEEDLPRPMAKKITASTTKVGLFSILPPPKHTGMAATLKLMPDRLKKTTPFQKPTLQAPKLPPKQLQPLVSSLLLAEEDDSDEEPSNDFFSLSKPVEEPVLVAPVAEPIPEIPIQRPIEPEPNPSPEIEMLYEPGPDLQLDDSALQQLCGGSKRKRTAVQAEIIDVSQRDLVPDRNEWMIKALTDEKLTRAPKQEVKNSLGRKKHQITYLADQAKANQVELEEQWAHNRMMKTQTRQKYGF